MRQSSLRGSHPILRRTAALSLVTASIAVTLTTVLTSGSMLLGKMRADDYFDIWWMSVAGLLSLAVAFGRDRSRGADALTWFLALLTFGLAFPLVLLVRDEYGYLLVEVLALVAAFVALSRFSLTFPAEIDVHDIRRTFPTRSWPHRLGRIIAGTSVQPIRQWAPPLLALAGILVLAVLSRTNSVGPPFRTEWPRAMAADMTFAAWGWLVVTVPVAMWVGYRKARGGDRRRLLWAVLGIQLFCVLGVAQFAFDSVRIGRGLAAIRWVEVLGPQLALGALLLGLGASVLYHGLLDPVGIINRTSLVAVGGVLVLLVFSAIESLISEWFETRLPLVGVSSSIVAGILTAALMAAGRNVLRRIARRVPRLATQGNAEDVAANSS